MPQKSTKNANVLIDYAFAKLKDLEIEKNKVACGGNGKMHYLDSLSKGRQVLKFLSKSKKPFTNRHFQVSMAKIREQEAQDIL